MSKETRIARTLRPFLVSSKFLGIFGCRIKEERVVVDTAMSRLYPLAWIIITYCCTIEMDSKNVNPLDLYARNETSKIARYAGTFFSVGSDMFVAIFQRNEIAKVFDTIDKYDRRLANLGFSRKDKTLIYRIILVIPVFDFILGLLSAVFDAASKSLIGIILFHYCYSMRYFIIFKLSILVHLIYQRFRYLNEFVVVRLPEINYLPYKKRSLTIYEIKYMHVKLCESAEILMNVYGPWVLLWFLVIAYELSGGLFNFKYRVGPSDTWLTVISVIGLCVSCGFASEEANKMARSLVERSSLAGDTTDTLNRIEMALYLCNHELRFTAMGVFTVNQSFILSMIKMILTYATLVRVET